MAKRKGKRGVKSTTISPQWKRTARKAWNTIELSLAFIGAVITVILISRYLGVW